MSHLIDEEIVFDHEAYAVELASRNARISDARRRGIAALERLIVVAKDDTGQSEVCGKFLLSIYNSSAYSFDMSDFRRLQDDLWDDCISVLAMDHRPFKEVDQLVDDGTKVWDLLKRKWATL